MVDDVQPRAFGVVMPRPTRTEEWQEFARAVRAKPSGTYLDANDITGDEISADSAKSLAWRINHGKAVAFRPARHYHARTEGARVSVTYVGPRPAQRAS